MDRWVRYVIFFKNDVCVQQVRCRLQGAGMMGPGANISKTFKC